MQEQLPSKSVRGMHRYVLGFVSLFLLIAASYPIALIRVSNSQKFPGFHVKSLSMEGKSVQQANQATNR